MSPTQVETEKLYPLNAYGSGMAPLFINLTLWIGVFMLMVIMRLEADGEDIAGGLGIRGAELAVTVMGAHVLAVGGVGVGPVGEVAVGAPQHATKGGLPRTPWCHKDQALACDGMAHCTRM